MLLPSRTAMAIMLLLAPVTVRAAVPDPQPLSAAPAPEAQVAPGADDPGAVPVLPYDQARSEILRVMADAATAYRATGVCGSPELDVAISRPMTLLAQTLSASAARTISPAQTVELVSISGGGLLRLADLALSAGCEEDAKGIYDGVSVTFSPEQYPDIAARARQGIAAVATGALQAPASQPPPQPTAQPPSPRGY